MIRTLRAVFLLGLLCFAAPAFAQSPELQAAWLRTGALNALGHYAEAETWANKAKELARQEFGENDPNYATSLGNLAELYYSEGRYAEAEPLYQRALAIRETAFGPDHPDVAASLDDLAMLYRAQGRYAEAEPPLRRALAILEKVFGRDYPDVATSREDLAELYLDEGRYATAEPLLKSARASLEKALGRDHPAVATSLDDLAQLYQVEGRYVEAEPLLKRALAIREGGEKVVGPDDPEVADSLSNLARLYHTQGRFAEAEPLYQRALAIQEKVLGPSHPDVATIRNNLGELYEAEGRYAEALPSISGAVAILSDRIERSSGIGALSEQETERPIFLNDVEITDHLITTGAADLPRLKEEGFAALQLAKASATAAAVAQMAARFGAASDQLAQLIRSRTDAQNEIDAQDEQLLKAASWIAPNADPKGEDERRATEQRLRDRISALSQQLRQRDAAIARECPGYAELSNPKPVTIASAQKLLAPDEALIAFAAGTNESYVAVVTNTSYVPRTVPISEKDLATAVRKIRASVAPDDAALEEALSKPAQLPQKFPFPAKTAYDLYRVLLAPAEEQLKAVHHIYVVTDGALESIPLSILLTAPPKNETLSDVTSLRNAPWLVERYAVSVLPSISSLSLLEPPVPSCGLALRQPPDKQQPFFGVGDPVLTGASPSHASAKPTQSGTVNAEFRGDAVDVNALRSLPPLPETAEELESEAKIFGAGPDSLLLGPQATVTAVMKADLKDRRILAFATHALVARDIGAAEPGLVMTPPAVPTPEDDGLLTASEIAQLNLDADLVILSACNTAASDGTPGAEGLSGLAKAFIYAGARALVVSHWEALSGVSKRLIEEMEAQAVKPHVGQAEALRLAMVETMRDPLFSYYAHPIFWAPFVVIGEGSAKP